jgi:hypothetical protein
VIEASDQALIVGRIRRDGWLSAALFLLGLISTLAFIRDGLGMRYADVAIHGWGIASWALGTLAQGAIAGGYIALGGSLVGRRAGRVSAWKPGMLLIAAGYAGSLLALVIGLVAGHANGDLSGEFHSTSYFFAIAVLMLSALWTAAAALLLAALLAGRAGVDQAEAAALRSRRLGWAVAGNAVLSGASALYVAIGTWGPWSFVVFSLNGAGPVSGLFRFAGYVVIAVTFIRAAGWFPESGITAYVRRERLLILGTMGLFISYTLDFASLFAGDDGWAGVLSGTKLRIASPGWGDLGLAIAVLCAIIGFWNLAQAVRAKSATR